MRFEMTTRHLEFEKDGLTPLVGSTPYSTREYWDHRFSIEPSKEWLASFSEIKDVLLPLLLPRYNCNILLIGNGNSNLAADLFDAGFTRITASDYSKTVVEKMREKHRLSHPAVRYIEADMLDLKSSPEVKDELFDVVIDKAGMDAIIADGGDSWNPSNHIKDLVHKVCLSVYSVLMHPSGLFIQLSFSQPHFRGKLLLQQKLKDALENSSSSAPCLPTLSSSSSSLQSSQTSHLAETEITISENMRQKHLEGKMEGEDKDDEEDEWEEDKQPGIGRESSISSTSLHSIDGTFWSSFIVKEVSVGLGYYLFVAET